MRSVTLLLFTILLPYFLSANDDRPPVPYNFLAKKEVKTFIDRMVKKHHFTRSSMISVLKSAKLDRDTLARYTGKYKVGSTNGPWERYKAHVLDPVTLDKAKAFKKRYYKTLLKASQEYQVDMEYIVGFIGVESKFGEYSGDYNVLDALTTLAFHKNRMKKFFKSELEHLFLMAREQNYDITTLQGSFAGAMGMVQQMPSVFRKFGMDYNRDGEKDPWDLEDAIGIIAKFMKKNGWEKGAQVAVPTKFKGKRYTALKTSHRRTLPLKTILKHGITPLKHFKEPKAYLLKNRNLTHDDIWLGAKNFRVLTRYNNSTSYGMTIHLIAQAVK
ncbi:lytic murein transglycosylase [Sulfurovum sp. XTW-4]|uniref:Lytic murein transglycosylase n=1 Tax=Sulfurovum xiamenensis TaxID=3019066 RepID=A0ABT7QTF9_9BACT|nr:lytic murein transglycosylase [Sulfurovum xiamenensis]MDM5264372.1 lytic murein transglycosylase [Sulfurovum xiamenensis]